MIQHFIFKSNSKSFSVLILSTITFSKFGILQLSLPAHFLSAYGPLRGGFSSDEQEPPGEGRQAHVEITEAESRVEEETEEAEESEELVQEEEKEDKEERDKDSPAHAPQLS